ncbi:MAG: CinA family nicotinamide mononucleotide deamidase-related protein [Lentisphaeria bacterium]|nr:CinA family nicotinamide mononucleotide deamidase-related protein [Lentisphaeria bacterium]
MDIAVVCTGTELLKGYTLNSNLARLGARLTAEGLPLSLELCVGDRAHEIGNAIALALKTCDVLILCGGLGPTKDDITLDVAARFFGCDLETDPELVRKVTDFWDRIHTGHCPKNQLRQARVPAGGHYLSNPVGSASGLAFSSLYGGRMRYVYLLPGPPTEFVPMMENYLVPELLELDAKRRFTLGFLAAAVGESTLAKAVEPVLEGLPVEIAYTAVPEGTKLFLEASDEELLASAVEKARAAVGKDALPAGAADLYAYLVSLLKERGLTFGTAESCTGGLIGKIMTDMPGVSEVYNGTVVAYANSVKERVLSIPREVLERAGAVSEETAALMAQHAAEVLGCSCAVSTTGIAGPDGGTEEKPVGLVYVGCFLNGRTTVLKLNLRGGREAIRQRAAARAVYQLVCRILEAYA